jgi:hypothetical protein
MGKWFWWPWKSFKGEKLSLGNRANVQKEYHRRQQDQEKLHS